MGAGFQPSLTSLIRFSSARRHFIHVDLEDISPLLQSPQKCPRLSFLEGSHIDHNLRFLLLDTGSINVSFESLISGVNRADLGMASGTHRLCFYTSNMQMYS